jgi:indole-3-glycerol phosphate synthase
MCTIAMIFMHQIIHEILESTRKRIPSTTTKRNIVSRNFKKYIDHRIQDNLIPVIAEPNFFKGSIKNLESVRQKVKIPVLRKDFILHKNQIYEVESDLILLIAGTLGDELDEFVNEAISSGREPLVEVHNKEELENAMLTATKIIGINNRDLTTMKVDITTTEKLAPLINDRIIISESGISSPEDALRMINAGADAILVGTSIMQGNVYEKTYELVHALEQTG